MRILGFIALLAGLAYAFILYTKSKIEVSVDLAKLDIAKVAAALAGIGEGKLKWAVDINVKNNSRITLRASGLDAKIYHQGTLIAKSAEVSPEEIIILPGAEEKIIHTLDVILSEQFFDLAQAFKSGQPLVLQYVVRIKLFGIPVKFKDNFTYTK